MSPKSWSPRRLLKETAKDFQKAIRAEAGAKSGSVRCVLNGEMTRLFSPAGYCVCVTCGKHVPWSGQFLSGHVGAHAGHFIPTRRNSIILEENNCHPQCNHCNKESGNPVCYHLYMMKVHGKKEIERLQWLKDNVSRKFEWDELEKLRTGYRDRWKSAEKQIKANI